LAGGILPAEEVTNIFCLPFLLRDQSQRDVFGTPCAERSSNKSYGCLYVIQFKKLLNLKIQLKLKITYRSNADPDVTSTE
jgi:hypothetical protein